MQLRRRPRHSCRRPEAAYIVNGVNIERGGAMSDTGEAPPRATYRHGDLRAALLAAGMDLARDGGPAAVVLREATRRAGVSPNAAYRHFADRQALLAAVSDAAQALAADAMEEEMQRAEATDGSPGARAHARLRAVGTGYLRFARANPGLFHAAFSVPTALGTSDSPAKAGSGGRTPYQLLTDALDALAAAGELPPDRRAHAEFLAWSSVHGLATLMIDGPLRGLPAELVAGVEQRLLDMVAKGL
jgi:AcrR family transcriptional regulator